LNNWHLIILIYHTAKVFILIKMYFTCPSNVELWPISHPLTRRGQHYTAASLQRTVNIFCLHFSGAIISSIFISILWFRRESKLLMIPKIQIFEDNLLQLCFEQMGTNHIHMLRVQNYLSCMLIAMTSLSHTWHLQKDFFIG